MKKTVSLLTLIIFAVSLFSCNSTSAKHTRESFEYFDTVTTVIGYGMSGVDFDETADRIFSRLSELHKLYDIYQSYDGIVNLHDVNSVADGVHPTLKVSEELMAMLEFSKEMHVLTGGEVNIAMGSVISLWHEKRMTAEQGNAELPDLAELTERAKHTDIDTLLLDLDAMTVHITDPKTTLDVGATAKGFAVETVARELEAEGKSGYIINVGGNVRTLGSKPNGEPFVAGITDPLGISDGGYAEYVNLDGAALVTSGSYQRYYTVDGKRYHHIIDKDTLYPSEYFASVSVISNDSGLADALSTALFSMSLEEGRSLLSATDRAEAVWMTPSGEKYYSDGFEAKIAKK